MTKVNVFKNCNSIEAVNNRIDAIASKHPDFKFNHKLMNDAVSLKIKYIGDKREAVYLSGNIVKTSETFTLSYKESNSFLKSLCIFIGILFLVVYSVCFAAIGFKDLDLVLAFAATAITFFIVYFAISFRHNSILKRIYKIIEKEMC